MTHIIEDVRLELESIIENSIRKVLNESTQKKNIEVQKEGPSDLLDIKQASELLGLAVPTLYSKVSGRLIPHSKVGKKLFFSREQLTLWIKAGDRKTRATIELEAENFGKRNQRKRS
jgi:excisionase family DNA binding protein